MRAAAALANSTRPSEVTITPSGESSTSAR